MSDRNRHGLDDADEKVLNAMSAWIELGNLQEAAKELDNMPKEKQNHVAVVYTRFAIALVQKPRDWNALRDAVAQAVQLGDVDMSLWLIYSNATRHATGGTLQAAYDILLRANELFPHAWQVSYHLGALASQMNRLDVAEEWMLKANEIAGRSARIKERAFFDPEYQNLSEDLYRRFHEEYEE